jgi:GGDEF domain-containing protein
MAVISLRKSVEQLDFAAEQRQLLQQALAHCIQTTGRYVVELNAHDADGLRLNLDKLAGKTEHLGAPAEWEQLSADFRGELRVYRDEEQQKAEHLRTEMASVVEAMQSFIASVSQNGCDHERTLRKEFETLESTAQTGDLDSIRKAIHSAVDTALKSCDQIRRSREIVIAQLQDEIRNLHREVDHERRAALTDPATGVWTRSKLDSRIKDLMLLNEAFCVFLVGVPDVVPVARQDPRLVPGCLHALGARLQAMAAEGGEIGMTGRWSEEVFAIVFNLPLAAVPLSVDAMRKDLSGNYAVQLDGESRDVQLAVNVQCVERPKDASETSFYLHLGQAAYSAISH